MVAKKNEDWRSLEVYDQRTPIPEISMMDRVIAALKGEKIRTENKPKENEQYYADWAVSQLTGKTKPARDFHGKEYKLVLPTILDVLQGRYKNTTGLPPIIYEKAPPADMRF